MFYLTLSQSTKKLLLLLLSALFAYWLLLAPAISWASNTQPQERMFQITATELTQLDNNLIQLQQSNGRLQNISIDLQTQLNLSQIELQKVRQQLTAAQSESLTLKNQLMALTQKSSDQEKLLESVNESFEKYAAEVKRERLRIKAQRNAWQAIATCAIIAFVAK